MKYNLTLLLFLISVLLFGQKSYDNLENPIELPCQNLLETITPPTFKIRKSKKSLKALSKTIHNSSLDQLADCVCSDSLWILLKKINYEQANKVPTSEEVNAITYYYKLPDQLDQMYLDRELDLYNLKTLEEKLEYITNRAVSKYHSHSSKNKYESTLTEHYFLAKNSKRLSDQYLAIIDNPLESQLKKEIILRSWHRSDKKIESELLSRIVNPKYDDLRSAILTTLSSIGSKPTISYLKQKVSEKMGNMDSIKPYLLALYTMRYSPKINEKSNNEINKFLKDNALDTILLSELAG